MGIRYVSDAICRQLVDVPQVVDRIEQAFRWEAAGRVVHAEPAALRMRTEDPPGKFHSKAVVLPDLGVAGFRIVGYRLQSDGTGPSAPESTRLVVLIDLATGSPMALVDEHYNYTLRTAASVAVAVRHLAPANPVLGVVGAGGVAHDVVRIFMHLLDLRGVLVTSRRPASRNALATAARAWGEVPVEPVEELVDMVARADLLVTATTTDTPLLDVPQLRAGMTICALGSNELTPAVYRHVDRLVVDDWAQTRVAHDVRPMVEAGLLAPEDLDCEIAQIVSGQRRGRTSPEETVLIRTEGLASQDICLAHWTYEAARDAGLGTVL